MAGQSRQRNAALRRGSSDGGLRGPDDESAPESAAQSDPPEPTFFLNRKFPTCSIVRPEFHLATEAAPEDPTTWGQLAWVLNYTQPPDAQAAEAAARRAIGLEPAGGPYAQGAFYQLGRSLMLQSP